MKKRTTEGETALNRALRAEHAALHREWKRLDSATRALYYAINRVPDPDFRRRARWALESLRSDRRAWRLIVEVRLCSVAVAGWGLSRLRAKADRAEALLVAASHCGCDRRSDCAVASGKESTQGFGAQ